MEKRLIVNADDFGASTGINRGILDCHLHGVVTSASLMVTGRAVTEAAAIARDHPRLGVGLHWDVWGEGEREFDLDDLPAVREEFRRQLDEFTRVMRRLPTHIDSHRHAHRRNDTLRQLFAELAAPLGVPVRDDGRVRFVGAFYAQWEWQLTQLDYVRTPFLLQMLREQVVPGWTEFSCHPGYRSSDFQSIYLAEREVEISTLMDPRVPGTLWELGIRLASFADFASENGVMATQAPKAACGEPQAPG